MLKLAKALTKIKAKQVCSENIHKPLDRNGLTLAKFKDDFQEISTNMLPHTLP